jgi:hypothetical protein
MKYGPPDPEVYARTVRRLRRLFDDFGYEYVVGIACNGMPEHREWEREQEEKRAPERAEERRRIREEARAIRERWRQRAQQRAQEASIESA